jgi:hypothetical protein
MKVHPATIAVGMDEGPDGREEHDEVWGGERRAIGARVCGGEELRIRIQLALRGLPEPLTRNELGVRLTLG